MKSPPPPSIFGGDYRSSPLSVKIASPAATFSYSLTLSLSHSLEAKTATGTRHAQPHRGRVSHSLSLLELKLETTTSSPSRETTVATPSHSSSRALFRISDFEMKLMDIDSEHLGIPEAEYHAISQRNVSRFPLEETLELLILSAGRIRLLTSCRFLQSQKAAWL